MMRAYIHHRGDRYQIEIWRRMDVMETDTLQIALLLAIHADTVTLDGECMSRTSQDMLRLGTPKEVNDATQKEG